MPKRKKDLKCIVCGEPYSCHFEGKPYCNKHYQRMRFCGNAGGRKRERTNVFSVDGDLLSITTKNGDLIRADAQDLEKLRLYSWCVSKTGYAVANIDGKVSKMHRYILCIDDPRIVVDHINHDKLDNRRINLRLCTQAENSRNKSPIAENIGIRLTKHGMYNVRITVNRKQIHIGNFSTIDEAVRARREAEVKYHGEYGYLTGGKR